jgi:hypothetical protein
MLLKIRSVGDPVLRQVAGPPQDRRDFKTHGEGDRQDLLSGAESQKAYTLQLHEG